MRSDYFPPVIVAIEPGGSVSRTVELEWPQTLDRLWNDRRLAAPPPGEYQMSVRIGYGSTPAPGPPVLGEGVEASVFRWQKEAVSPAVAVTVPEYRGAPQS